MIIKAKHHWFLNPFFHWYARQIIGRHFFRVEAEISFTDRHLPVLLLGNHSSWWDGFFASYINHHYLRRRFHFMMQQEHLQKNWFFQYTGGFSVKKHSRTLVESLLYAAELLASPQNMVLLYPQGEIQSVFEPYLRFEKGTDYIFRRLKNPVHLLFLATLSDYFSNKKPVLFLFLKEYSGEAGKIQAAYNAFYDNCKQKICSKKSIEKW